MLTKIERSDIPRYRSAEKSPLRRFAGETLREFLRASEVGDVAEVTGAPVDMDARGTQRLAEALRNELFYMGRNDGKYDEASDMRRHVRVITRGGSRVFLERVKPWVPKNRY